MKNDLPLRCPCNRKALLSFTPRGLLCTQEGCEHAELDNAFTIVGEVPLLVSEIHCDTVYDTNKQLEYVPRPYARLAWLQSLILGTSSATKRNCERFVSLLNASTKSPKVLVIGSGEKGSGTDLLWNNKNIIIHGIDIYLSETVDVVCDAHYLPFADGAYDGVWIQAVLEHVVEPNVVAAEIFRVLKDGGIIYAETPFMQQVHEGAYDFNRFTVLGHRYLFRAFELIDMGGNKGPEVVLAWSLRYLFWSLTRSRMIGRCVALACGFLLRPLEPFISARSMHDAASGVFFLGRKVAENKLSHKELVSLYRGQC